MKLDDRDIVCETDLSDHEFEAALDAAIETGNPDARVKVVEMYYESRMETAYAYQRATSADSRFEVTYADNRAALARAEAAEAEAARLQYDLDRQLYRADVLAARVAELESQLAAQGWRPVTEDWPPYNERVIIGHGGGYGGGWSAFARRVRTDNRDGDDWLMDDDTTLAFESAVVAMRRPLPPRPTGDDALAPSK